MNQVDDSRVPARRPRRSSGRARRLPSLGALLLLAGVLLVGGCAEESTNPPVLEIEPALLALAASDTVATVTIHNRGHGLLTWTLIDDAPWLVPDQTGGHVVTTRDLTLRIARDSLWLGPCQAQVEVTSNGGGAQLRVGLQPALAVFPESLAFDETEISHPVTIVNQGSDGLRWSGGCLDAWVHFEPSEGTVGAEAETVRVMIDRTELAIGSHAGQAWIDAGARGVDTVWVTAAVSPTRDVSGHVYFAGTLIPVPGVVVSVGEIATVTDTTGAYTLAEVPQGARTIRAEKPDFDPVEEVIEVSQANLVWDASLTSAIRMHTVTGRVINAREAGLRRAEVAILNPDGTPSTLVTNAEEDGSYALAGVPEGERWIAAGRSGYEDLLTTRWIDADHRVQDLPLVAVLLPPPSWRVDPALCWNNCSTVRAQWGALLVETLGGYYLERAPTASGPFVDISGLLAATRSTFDDHDLEQGTYYYRLRSETIDGEPSEPSEVRGIDAEPWRRLHDGTSAPAGRWGQIMIYDPLADRVLLYAGADCLSGTCNTLDDLWEFDPVGYTWNRIWYYGARPARRSSHVGVYDPVQHALVVHGGWFGYVSTVYRDTWVLDLATETWHEVEADVYSSPPARYGHTAVLDPVARRMVIFGGRGRDGADVYNDVWALDLTGETWSVLHPGGSTAPQARYFHSAVYDPLQYRLIVHGGAVGPNDFRNDTWAFDLATEVWSELPETPTTTERYGHCAYFDLERNRMIITDVGVLQPLSFNWALALDTGEWSALDDGDPDAMPPGRVFGTLVHHGAGGGLILFGGKEDFGNQLWNDTWAYCRVK